MNSFSFTNAEVLFPDGLAKHPLNVDDTGVSQSQGKITFDLQGFMVLPGIVDLHGDGFERHLAPRRGAVKDLQNGLEATITNCLPMALQRLFWRSFTAGKMACGALLLPRDF